MLVNLAALNNGDQARLVRLDTYAARRDAYMLVLALRRIGNDILVDFTYRNGCRFAACFESVGYSNVMRE